VYLLFAEKMSQDTLTKTSCISINGKINDKSNKQEHLVEGGGVKQNNWQFWQCHALTWGASKLAMGIRLRIINLAQISASATMLRIAASRPNIDRSYLSSIDMLFYH